jgi:hypothetical protein
LDAKTGAELPTLEGLTNGDKDRLPPLRFPAGETSALLRYVQSLETLHGISQISVDLVIRHLARLT